MAISTSPRKIVPLNSGEDFDSRPKPQILSSGSSVTKRAFFCGVVVEGPNDGRELSEDVQDLVASLGDRLPSDIKLDDVTSPHEHLPQPVSKNNLFSGPQTRKKAATDATALTDLIDELVTTERSYVKRIRILKESYADPLRSYARSKDTAIIPAYEAKILFGNIDNLVPVNEAFLHDLELMITPEGHRKVGGIGDVALRHFRDLRAFDCYKQYYIKREEAQNIFKREMSKKSSTGFAAFVERIKYTTSDTKNRIGLRELLMDPVQRIPRYTLLFRTMIKRMHPSDHQRAKLVEAEDLASKIALAETDDQTKRAAIMYCLGASIEGFPPGLISNSRRFIDCIDVEDTFGDTSSSIPSSSSASMTSSGSGFGVLPCTLFLFDDKLLIVKRPPEKSGRALAGLDDIDKFTNGAGFPRGGMKKSGMSCKGVIDVVDMVATDVSGPDMHFYFETPPGDQSERWSGRPFRVLSVAHPPAPINHDPIRTEQDKKRFLENLWDVQARYRTKVGQSVVLCAEDREVESRAGRVTIARTYFNVYQRTSFLKEPKRKTKVVVHIDALGCADPLPFGMNGPPFVVVRVQPMAGELCRYTVSSSDPEDEPEEDIVQTARVPGRIVQTIHQYGLFKFKTGNHSRPTTPTTSIRSRAHIFGLDVISRNLFASKGDLFGNGSLTGHKRSKSSTSRTSTRTDTTIITASDSLLKFSGSQRTGSTAGTSAYAPSVADEEEYVGRSVSRSKKLVKRSKSKSPGPGGYASEEESIAAGRHARSRSRSEERGQKPEYGNFDGLRLDPSELDLTMRLELARRNSRNQHNEHLASNIMEKPIEDTIYEEEPPLPVRPSSRAASSRTERDGNSLRSTTPPRPGSVTPTHASDRTSPHKGRAPSMCSPERRPWGPRPASPLPPTTPELPSMEIEMALETTLANMHGAPPRTPSRRGDERERGRSTRTTGLKRDYTGGSQSVNVQAPVSPSPSPMPRSRRQPFEPRGNTDCTPMKANLTGEDTGASKAGGGVEPLSIKKKTSANAKSPAAATAARKSYARNSLARTSPKSSRPGQARKHEATASVPIDPQSTGTSTSLESSCRAIKRIKLEVTSLPANANASRESDGSGDDQGIRSPRVGARTPQRGSAAIANANAPTKEALQRMEEMRQLIGQRGFASPRSRPLSTANASTSRPASPEKKSGSDVHELVQSITEIADDAERHVEHATRNHESLESELQVFAVAVKDNYVALEKTRTELRGAKRQCELVKNLLADATAENEIMYEAFNEELDGMFNDANLPEDEAWTAMTEDLRKTKETRNNLTNENAQLKRRLQEAEMQRDEWGALLRAHGLIP
ncbi:hypothetical protein BD410DRAFT_811372 [Rickenella mellea]|uniref:DH domain-containing protein n=1 Tax=Rickenella mellea TaxID=50990 RepID=A0A4V3AZP0_9AGAM|nr:hypothetical protein BD410DRAFT_811372 [Rickenella mellea]